MLTDYMAPILTGHGDRPANLACEDRGMGAILAACDDGTEALLTILGALYPPVRLAPDLLPDLRTNIRDN